MPSGSGSGGVDVIVDWELPLFSLNGISDITSPEFWTFEIIRGSGPDVGKIVKSNPNFIDSNFDNGGPLDPL